jgi:carboxypeptidase D
MHHVTLLALAAYVCSAAARASPARYLGRDDLNYLHARDSQAYTTTATYGSPAKPSIIPQNKNTTKFKVDGTKIPEVNFDIGESAYLPRLIEKW